MLTTKVSSCTIDLVYGKLICNYLLASRELGDRSIRHFFTAPDPYGSEVAVNWYLTNYGQKKVHK